VGLPFAKRRKLAWLSGYAIFGFMLYNIDFESLGSHVGPILYASFCLLALAGFTSMVIRDFFVIGGLFAMGPKDWQKEFDEAKRLANRKTRTSKESSGP